MSKEDERIEKWECNGCSPGLPPCKLEIPTENPWTSVPDQCFYSFKNEGKNPPDWKLVAYKRVKFDWKRGIEKELTDWIKDSDNRTYPNKRRNNYE